MSDEWSGLADLLATLIEKYASEIIDDNFQISSMKSTEKKADNSCNPLEQFIDNGQAA